MERSGTWLATAATPPQVNPRAWLVLASLLTSPHRLLFAIHTVYMENVLCQIHSNANNLHLGLLLSGDWWTTLPVWLLDAA